MPKERVTRVVDGDTFMTEERKRAVRIANIDMPEKGEPGAKAATKKLEKMIGGKDVLVTPVAKDTYGRTVAKVSIAGKSVGKAMKPPAANKKKASDSSAKKTPTSKAQQAKSTSQPKAKTGKPTVEATKSPAAVTKKPSAPAAKKAQATMTRQTHPTSRPKPNAGKSAPTSRGLHVHSTSRPKPRVR